MTLETLAEKMQATGLIHHLGPLQAALRPTIRLYPVAEDEEAIPLGQTRIGGQPDLPEGLPWPSGPRRVQTTEKTLLFFSRTREETVVQPLSFIAQINLAEVADRDSEGLLPQTGMLYFFYCAEQQSWGFEPSDGDSFRVLYYDGPREGLARASFPQELPAYGRYQASSVKAVREVSVPADVHEAYAGMSEEESERFWEEVYDTDEVVNKLLGYSDNIQNDMELECELVTNGIYCGDSSGYADPRAKELEPRARDWRLLLQIDSNEVNGMMWGDVGRLYFWIREDDLRQRRFERAWMVLQCS